MTLTAFSEIGAGKRLAVLVAIVAASGCGLDKQTAPSFVGPSGYALSVALSASPDILRRDGVSRSTIVLTAHGAQGEPAGNRRFLLEAAAGSLSAQEVVTGSDGRATFEFVAPEADVNVGSATITAVPFGNDFGSTPGNSVRVGLVGPAFATASFTYSPAAPTRLQAVTFNASTTAVDGAPCLSACTYRWEFNDEATLDGQVVEYAFQEEGFYNVKLTVHSLKHNTTSTAMQRLKVGLVP